MKVSDNFRTNSLSTIPGGSVVTITYINKKPLEYDKIKDTKRYADKIIRESKISGELSSILSIVDNQGNKFYEKKQTI
jgi:hypothetical protein